MEPVVGAGGLAAGVKTEKAGPTALFRAAQTSAYNIALPGMNTGSPRSMLISGFDLINANCKDYFHAAGNSQGVMTFMTDATLATATFSTAAMAFNPRNKKKLGIVPILAGGVYGGIDVYNKNFLFASDNIDAVHTLTMTAVSAHQEESLKKVEDSARDDPLTYGRALAILQDNQAYCEPPRILQMVRKAIKNGTVGVVKQAAPDPEPDPDSRTEAEKKQDSDVLQKLGARLNPPGTLSLAQAGAFYWLFEASNSAPDRKQIFLMLQDLPTAAQPLDGSGTYKSAWDTEADIRLWLQEFSAQTKAHFEAAIMVYQTNVAAKTAATENPSGGSLDLTTKAVRKALVATPLAPPDFVPSRMRAYSPVKVDVQ